MNIYTIYFSPTGRTKIIAQQLAKGWSKPAVFIDLSDKTLNFASYTFMKDDLCLIAVPSFGGRVPAIALHQLSLMKGAGASTILITSFGNRAHDDTLLELQNATTACGFNVIAGIAAIAEHSIMRQFGANRPDTQDLIQLNDFALKLSNLALNQIKPVKNKLPGNQPYRPYNGVPLKPQTSKQCKKCGHCSSLCPVSAIPKENPSQTNGSACISCMRCIAICPSKARFIPKLMLSVASKTMKKACLSRKENELYIL